MNRRHFAVILCLLAVGFGMILYINANKTINKYDEIEELNRSLSFAASSAVYTLKELYGEPYYINEVSREFFDAFNLNTFDGYEDLWNYVPGFIFLDTTGYRMGGLDESTYEYVWSEVTPYELTYISDSGQDFKIRVTLDNTITLVVGTNSYTCEGELLFASMADIGHLQKYEKLSRTEFFNILTSLGFTRLDYNPSDEVSRNAALKEYERIKESAIATCVSNAMTELVNNHNKIMAARGCKYEYVTPAFHDFDTDLPSFVVCFQGYPLRDGKYYSNLHSRGAYITRFDSVNSPIYSPLTTPILGGVTPTNTPIPTATPLPVVAYGLFDEYGIAIASYDDLVNDYGLEIQDSANAYSRGTYKAGGDNLLSDIIAYNNWESRARIFVVPNTADKVGQGAFSNCKTLINVELPDGITQIQQNAFDKCESLSEIDVPDSVQYIGDYAFCDCKSLTDIVLPDNLINISVGLFRNAVSLSNVILPSKLEAIMPDAFNGCTSLKNINFPSSLQYIGDYAFAEAKLTNVNLPESLKSIGEYAFNNNKLTTVTIPSSIQTLDKAIFNVNFGVTEVLYDDVLYITKNSLKQALLDNGVELDEATFQNTGLKSDVDFTGYFAVRAITKTTATGWSFARFNVNAGDEVKWYVEYNAEEFGISPNADLQMRLYNNNYNTNNGIYLQTEGIGVYSGTQTVSKDGSATLGIKFTNAAGRLGIKTCRVWVNDELIIGTIPELEAGIYDSYYNQLVTWDELVNDYNMARSALESKKILLKNILLNNEKFQNASIVVVSDKETTVGLSEFGGCTQLTDIYLSDSITMIDKKAFDGCTALKHIRLSQNLIEIQSWAFKGCTSLSDIEWSDSITTIREHSLESIAIKNLVLPANLEIVKDYAFANIATLETVEYYGNTLKEIGTAAFVGNKNCRLINISNSAEGFIIGEGAFSDNGKNIEELVITLPDNLVSISSYAFRDSPTLKEIIIPEGVIEIGVSAFQRDTNLSNVSLPSTLKTIGQNAFMLCKNLDLRIPDGVENIGLQAMDQMPHITYYGDATGAPWGAKSMN